MHKKLLTLLIITILALAALSGCQSYKYGPISGGSAEAVVVNNGGLAVKQGDYLYFINGFADYDDEDAKTNYFGSVLKGAIMRGVLNTDGSLTDVQVVVPKKVMSTSTDNGIFVFGEWIYYVSPGTGVDNKGNVLIDYIDFYRTSIDGTKTDKIITIKGNAAEFTFTHNALAYYVDNELHTVDLTSKKFKDNLVDEHVTKVIFTVNPVFDPAHPDTTADYIVYSKASDNDLDQNNIIYSIKANGADKTELINKSTYTADSADLEHIYTISLLGSSVTDGKLAIYYTKTTVAKIANTERGLYGYEFSEAMSITPASEKCFSLVTTASIYPVSFIKGVFILDAKPKVLALAQEADELAPTKTTYKFPETITILGITATGGKDYVYYLTNSQVHRFPLDSDENAALVTTQALKTGWSGPDFIGGYMFYINTGDYNYTYMANLNTFSITDSESFKNAMIGTMTEEDSTAKAEAQEK